MLAFRYSRMDVPKCRTKRFLSEFSLAKPQRCVMAEIEVLVSVRSRATSRSFRWMISWATVWFSLSLKRR